MSHTSVKDAVKLQLWGQAAGRCEYEGCPKVLFRDDVTTASMNAAYVAHIIADSPGGPRGDPGLSQKLAGDISNLMILCDVHHRMIDHEQRDEHPAGRLRRMKAAHEERVELLTSIAPEKKSHVVLYGANIGDHSSTVSGGRAFHAMVPDRYPASARPIELGMRHSAAVDHDPDFWSLEEQQLRRQFDSRLKELLASGEATHLSVFAVARFRDSKCWPLVATSRNARHSRRIRERWQCVAGRAARTWGRAARTTGGAPRARGGGRQAGARGLRRPVRARVRGR